MRRGRVVAGALRLKLILLLLVCALLMPQTSATVPGIVLLRSQSAASVDHPKDMLWILALGSDARKGEDPLRTRADAIQLVGVNFTTGAAANIGIPRDSYVAIPGFGNARINAALEYGGPELMTQTVQDLVGIAPDVTVLTTFDGFRALIRSIGGVTVYSRLAFADDNMVGDISAGKNTLNGFESLFFVRARHYLPRGDFDRSANQQQMLRSILRQVRANGDTPGYLERAVLAVATRLRTDLNPREMYRLAQALRGIDPAQYVGCVLDGSIGYAGPASVVFPDRDQATRLGNEARRDGTFESGC